MYTVVLHVLEKKMLNKIAEFILDKRLKEMEERIKALEDKFKKPIPPIVETPPIYRYAPRRK